MFKKAELQYFGHIVGKHGIKPNPGRITAVTTLASPENVAELRRCLGMINYLGRFLPSLSQIIKPMTELLKENTAWSWGPQQETAFKQVKEMVTRAPTLGYYQPECETIVSADASSYGLGGVLMQRQKDRIVPIAFCSRTLTPAECHYSQIEKECLVSVWTCEKFQRYLMGLPDFELQTDHKPLVPLMMSKDLDQGPIRCQRLLMRLMRFNPHVRHVPGKTLTIADALSRSPLPHTAEDEKRVEEIEMYIETVTKCLPASITQVERVKRSTAQDPLLQQIAAYVMDGWPASVSLPVVPYEQVKGELSLYDGLLLRGQCMVIPQELQREMLERIHEGHQGKVKSRERANSAVWWPGLSRDISALIEACPVCTENRPAQRHEPLKPTKLPGRPWEKIACDLCEHKQKHYLVTYDYYSRWIDIKLLQSTTSNAIIAKLKNVFSVHGIPDVLQSDNGPQFSASEFQSFANFYGFKHVTTSPYMPQANGGVERTVGISKKILSQKNTDLALLNYRATAHTATGISPAEALMGRKLKTRLPILPVNLEPQVHSYSDIAKADERAKKSYKMHYDKRHGVRSLPELNPGQSVLMKLPSEKKWQRNGKVVFADQENRTYKIAAEGGGIIQRNRVHLQSAPEEDDESQQPERQPERESQQPERGSQESVLPEPPKTTSVVPVLRRSQRTIVKPARYRDE